ncbi:hypothetical protein [Rufibacter sp. LB8]|uniref:hypothetical protein n=1 Tax=Rufibacter sp. LB8 TaxID=2777781 RepID=UPI00178C567B|nr:hypothetical protein [Rufibacter sp. LB8]
MKRPYLFPVSLFMFLAGILLGTISCDSTPRERKETVNREIDKLDETVESVASKTKEEAKEARAALARKKAEDALRKSRTPAPGKLAQMEQELLGAYSNLGQTTPENLKDAYVNFLQQVRARKDAWSMEDWDYANGIYKRLNAREKELHDDIILRHATKIKALQAEYLALENKADLGEYQRIKKEQAGN